MSIINLLLFFAPPPQVSVKIGMLFQIVYINYCFMFISLYKCI